MLKNAEFVRSFASIGEDWDLTSVDGNAIQSFVCALYGDATCSGVDKRRWETTMFLLTEVTKELGFNKMFHSFEKYLFFQIDSCNIIL